MGVWALNFMELKDADVVTISYWVAQAKAQMNPKRDSPSSSTFIVRVGWLTEESGSRKKYFGAGKMVTKLIEIRKSI
jgi:hypothetical protein